MNKFKFFSVIFCAAAFFTAACSDDKETPETKVVKVESVSVDPDNINCTVGTNGLRITAAVLPQNADNKAVTWVSDNRQVVLVDDDGNLIILNTSGKAIITVTTVDGGKTASCTVTVSDISVIGVEVDPTELTMYLGGESAKLVAAVLPSNATNKQVSWSSSDDTVVEVDQEGNLTAKSGGTATITVTTAEGSHKATCAVTVEVPVASVDGVSIVPDEITIKMGDPPLKLEAVISPSNAANKNVEWASDDETVVEVDQEGYITAISEGGPITITVTTEDGGYTATCEITVKAAAAGGENLLKNPGFEEADPGNSNFAADWTAVPQQWFTDYYTTAPGNEWQGWTGNPQRVEKSTANISAIAGVITGDYGQRLAATNTQGVYQIVSVEAGKVYEFSVTVGFTNNDNANQAPKDEASGKAEYVKVLSEDGLTTYGRAYIPAQLSTVMTVTDVTIAIPAGVTKVLFQIDQRDYPLAGAGSRAPIMVVDDCVFREVGQ